MKRSIEIIKKDIETISLVFRTGPIDSMEGEVLLETIVTRKDVIEYFICFEGIEIDYNLYRWIWSIIEKSDIYGRSIIYEEETDYLLKIKPRNNGFKLIGALPIDFINDYLDGIKDVLREE